MSEPSVNASLIEQVLGVFVQWTFFVGLLIVAATRFSSYIPVLFIIDRFRLMNLKPLRKVDSHRLHTG